MTSLYGKIFSDCFLFKCSLFSCIRFDWLIMEAFFLPTFCLEKMGRMGFQDYIHQRRDVILKGRSRCMSEEGKVDWAG